MNTVHASVPHPHFDNTQMHNRQEVKRAQMHEEHNEKRIEYYKAKNVDWQEHRLEVKQDRMMRDIKEINQYLNLKQHIEYNNYRYGITLGNYLDVYV
jgi:hypothetical protein